MSRVKADMSEMHWNFGIFFLFSLSVCCGLDEGPHFFTGSFSGYVRGLNLQTEK